jgi:hypothetical protein
MGAVEVDCSAIMAAIINQETIDMRLHALAKLTRSEKKHLFSDSSDFGSERKKSFPGLVKSMVLCLAVGAAAGVSAQQTSSSAASPASAKPMTFGSAATDPNAWRFALTPYIWLPTINANINYPVPSLPNGGGGSSGLAPDGSLNSEIGPNDYLSKLNFALMLNGEVRRGPWSATFDYIGIKATGLGSRVNSFKPFDRPDIPVSNSVNTSTTSTIKTTLWTLTAGYELIANNRMSLDGFAGARFGNLDTTVDWNLSAQITLPNSNRVFARQGTASNSRNLSDGIVGVRGRYRFGEQWSMPYYLDVGTGSSQFTWQAMLGASYTFGWGDVILAYRHLSMTSDESKPVANFELSGPMIGATFRF